MQLTRARLEIGTTDVHEGSMKTGRVIQTLKFEVS